MNKNRTDMELKPFKMILILDQLSSHSIWIKLLTSRDCANSRKGHRSSMNDSFWKEKPKHNKEFELRMRMSLDPTFCIMRTLLWQSLLVFLTFILDRTYAWLLCDLLLTPGLSSGRAAGLFGWPSMVLDGSSACVCVSERDCLVRHSGVISAGLASASIVRTDGGKMDTGGREERLF